MRTLASILLAFALPCAAAQAQACRIVRWHWTCASGPVVRYEVVMGSRYAGSVPGCSAYLEFALASVRVRAVDAEGRTGPWSPRSRALTVPDFNALRESYA